MDMDLKYKVSDRVQLVNGDPQVLVVSGIANRDVITGEIFNIPKLIVMWFNGAAVQFLQIDQSCIMPAMSGLIPVNGSKSINPLAN
jgi:uncharacterized protein YodC (DUF2158 family)